MLQGTIDGSSFTGTAVGSTSKSHTITISSDITVNYFTMDSCHRSIQFSDIIQEPWYTWVTGPKSVGFTFLYNEASTIEDNGNCILRFCSFSKTVGAAPSSCAVVDFKSDRFTLPSENICNGADYGKDSSTGTSVCHVKVGLIERMQFDGPVVVAPQVIDPTGKIAPYWIKDQCVGSFIDSNQSLFQYIVPENECEIEFMEKISPYRKAKLTVFAL